MPKFLVEGKLQVAVTMVVEACNWKDALVNAELFWGGVDNIHTGTAVSVAGDNDHDTKICDDGSEPEWVDAELIKDDSAEKIAALEARIRELECVPDDHIKPKRGK